MEKIVRCMDCGYCDVDSWGAWCNKENAQLNDVRDEHKCDSFFPRIEKEASFQQLSKALCGKENATLDEMLEAAEQLKHRAEPENRPLTLDEIWEAVDDDDWNFLWLEYNFASYTLQIIPHHMSKAYFYFHSPVADEEERKESTVEINKEWRCWPRKPTPEQMAAEKWEE